MGVPGRLGRYAVRRRLGSGGFATVWLAYDEQLDAEVAIKVLADNWVDDDSVRRRFLEEGRFLRRVESEHVVQVHDVGELEDGRPFLVLTYADRGTLADRIRSEPLKLAEAVDVVVQIGRGLQALHRRGLLHRDVKPANVLFRSTDDGERAVLSDLGLGKSLDEVSRITIPGGTPSYVAPEQALGERLDARADQYSLGAVAYAALTGQSPHRISGLGAAGRVDPPPRPSELGVGVPDRIEDAIMRALQPDREDRWPDVAAFSKELIGGLNETTKSLEPIPLEVAEEARSRQDRLVTVPGTSADETTGPLAPADRPTVRTRPPRRRWPWVFAALLAIAAGSGGGFYGQRYLAGVEMTQIGESGFGISVPRAWAKYQSNQPWRPPGSGQAQQALRASANLKSAAPGVFLGILPGAKLPTSLPTHTECSAREEQSESNVRSLPAITRVDRDCGDGTFLLERVVQVDKGKLLWIQVRAADRGQAVDVADSFVYTQDDTP